MQKYSRSSGNCFGAGTLDRLGYKRQDEAWINARLTHPESRFILMWRSKHLFSKEDPPLPVLLSREAFGDLWKESVSSIFLGMEAETVYFAIDLPPENTEIPAQFFRWGEFLDLRNVATFLDASSASRLAYAKAITQWHKRHRFCGDCGHPTQSLDGGHRRLCTQTSCQREHFPRTDPAIIVLVTHQDQCLLAHQAKWPKGVYSTLAGFVEPGETLEDAVAREVLEEAGIQIGSVVYHSSQPWPFPGSIMLGFTAQAETQNIDLKDHELEDAQWFSREDLKSGLKTGHIFIPPDMSIAYRLIEDWFNQGHLGLLTDAML